MRDCGNENQAWMRSQKLDGGLSDGTSDYISHAQTGTATSLTTAGSGGPHPTTNRQQGSTRDQNKRQVAGHCLYQGPRIGRGPFPFLPSCKNQLSRPKGTNSHCTYTSAPSEVIFFDYRSTSHSPTFHATPPNPLPGHSCIHKLGAESGTQGQP